MATPTSNRGLREEGEDASDITSRLPPNTSRAREEEGGNEPIRAGIEHSRAREGGIEHREEGGNDPSRVREEGGSSDPREEGGNSDSNRVREEGGSNDPSRAREEGGSSSDSNRAKEEEGGSDPSGIKEEEEEDNQTPEVVGGLRPDSTRGRENRRIG